MKKHIVYLILTVFVLGIFACTIPSAVEIKGSRNLEIAANVNMGKHLDEQIKSIIGDMETSGSNAAIRMIPTTQPTRTYIIQMDVDFNIDLDAIILSANPVLHGALQLAPEVAAPADINLDGGTFPIPSIDMTEALQGFSLSNNTKARIYVSADSGFLNSVLLSTDIGSVSTVVNLQPSGLDVYNIDNEYTANSLPNFGIPINLPLDGSEAELTFSIAIPKDTMIQKSWLDEENTITVEIAVWFVLELVAGVDGAVFDFPSMFSDGDVFFRDNAGSDSMLDLIEAFTFGIKLSSGVFDNMELKIINSPDEAQLSAPIIETLQDSELTFGLSEDELDEINGIWPFIPQISILIPKNKVLSIPREIKLEKVWFDVSFNYREEF